MDKIKRTFATRVYALVICFALVLSAIPASVITAWAVNDMGTLSGTTEGGTVTDESSENAVVSYSNATLDWEVSDEDNDKKTDGWWVAVKMAAPDNFNVLTSGYNETTFQEKVNGDWGTARIFWNEKDSTFRIHYINLAFEINEQMLNDAIIAGEMIEHSWRFDWENDGDYEQTITAKVDPENVVLMKDGVQVYPAVTGNGTVSAISDGLTVNNANANIVEVVYNSDVTLKWSEANAAEGIDADGWYAGMKMTAPESLKVEDDFANVTYQKLDGTQWSAAESFWAEKNSADGDTTHFLNMWGLINKDIIKATEEKGEDETADYTYRFDWNKDGVYEQIVTLKINPKYLTLLDENNGQVYPELGTVTPLTGGTVKGETYNLELVIDEATLDWSDADPSIGRVVAGWYVGMKVTAPEGYSADALKSAKYNNRSSDLSRTDNDLWGDWRTSDSSFWNAKDSAEDAQKHFIYMWIPITAGAFKAYSEAGEPIQSQYAFDWDNNGTKEQTITIKVIPSDKIVLNKIPQTGFGFETPVPADQWVGAKFKNPALGGQSTGDISYEIVSGSDFATIDETSGELTFKAVGVVTVRATKAEDDTYAKATAEYTVKAIRYPQTNFKFENSNHTIEVAFSEETYSNIASGGEGSGAVTYSIISGNDIATIDENTGLVTFIKAGEITVKAVKGEDNSYYETSATYILNITTSEQLPLNVTAPVTITYSDASQSVINVSGGSGDGEVTYSIVDGNDVAKINSSTGDIKTLKSGSFTVRVEKAGFGGYNAAIPVEKTIVVEKANQNDFAFEKSDCEVMFNDNGNVFNNTVKGGNGSGDITYEIVTGEDVASIDSATGILTIKQAGSVLVKATKAADDCYNEAVATYTIIINKDEPAFSVANINLTYGTTEKQIEIIENEDKVGDGSYSYQIIGNNEIGAEVDSSGLITFEDSEGKVGEITIRVTKAADNKYEESSVDFTVTVDYLTFSDKPVVTGETKNSSGWYTGTVTITAPAGYQISYDNKLSTSDWSQTVTVNTNADNNVDVYLKSIAEGYITDAINFNSIKIDTNSPENLDITYDTGFWEKILETLTFAVYEAKTVEVTLSATDLISGVDFFEYDIGNGPVKVESKDFTTNNDGVATYTFPISVIFRDKVSMTVTDVAGNKSEKTETGRVLVVDSESPVLNVKFDSSKIGESEKNHTDYNDVIYSKEDIKVIFEISEANFDLRKSDPVFKVGSLVAALQWSYDSSNDVWCAEQIINSEGVSQLNLTFTDASANEMAEYNKTVVVDKTAPVLSTLYTGTAVKDNIFNTERTATVTITEINFDAKDVELSVTAKDINGNPVDISANDYQNFAKNSANWTHNGAIHTLNIPFNIDGIYEVDFNYKDLAGNAIADYTADNFVVDTTGAQDIKIEYSKSIVDKLIEGITFGFYKGDVDVKISANDYTSGIDFFEFTYSAVDGDNNSNKPSYSIVPLDAVQGASEKMFTATHTIPADARGTVSVVAVDNAENNASAADDKVLVADVSTPGIKAEYIFVDGMHQEIDGVEYTQNQVTSKFTITEANFDVAEKPVVTVSKDGKAPVIQTVNWSQTTATDDWVGEIVLDGEGDYVVNVNFTDGSTNSVTYKKEIHIDSTASVSNVTYADGTPEKTFDGIPYYNSIQTAKITITEHNFDPAKVDLKITAKNINNVDIDLSAKDYSAYAKNPANWSQRGDVWTLNTAGMALAEDGIYHVELSSVDKASNVSDTYAADLVVDTTVSQNINIEYSQSLGARILNGITFGLYKGDVEVKVTAEDETAGVDYFELTYTRNDGTNKSNKDTYTVKLPATEGSAKNVFTATHTIEADARGTVSVVVFDKATNSSEKDDKSDNKGIIADETAPEWIEPVYTFYSGEYQEYNDIFYTQLGFKAKFTIKEANFDIADKPVVTVSENGKEPEIKTVEWKQTKGTDEWVGSLSITGNGDYVINVGFEDASQNEKIDYTQKICVNALKPNINVTYNSGVADNTFNKVPYYKTAQTMEVAIIEHNFDAEKVHLTVSAKNINDKPIDISSKDYSAYVKNPANWTSNGDTRILNTAGMVFDIDGIYDIELYCINRANKKSDVYTSKFVVDKTSADKIKIEYSESVIDKILNGITFGFYKGDIKVTVTAEDVVAGVDFFDLTYTRNDGENESNKDTYSVNLSANQGKNGNENVFTATHTIEPEARGNVSVKVTDKATNESSLADGKVIVTDTKTPGIVVDYTFTNNQKRVENNIFYTQGETDIDFAITEANFDVAEKPVVTVSKDDGEPVAQNVVWTETDGKDEWTSGIPLEGNGDYIVKVEFADSSSNKMTTYEQKVHIDNNKPVFDVTYDNNSALNDNNYKEDRNATIKVTEHNFKPQEVEFKVSATDVTGKKINLDSKAYTAYAANPANWVRQGDVWTLKTSNSTLFDIDGKYTVTLDYTDLAENVAETYKTTFVIDHAKPTDLKIDYSVPLLEKVIDKLTFGYYKESVEVTLTANDITSGVDYFNWAYTKQVDSSEINENDIAKVIATDEITYSNDGKTATATFTIPANARGHIAATVTDKAGNANSYSDDKRIVVVDEIAPTRTVSYNPYRVLDEETLTDVETYTESDPVILYYKSDATVTFTVNEANFYKEDVKINVIKNEGAAVAYAPKDWTQNGDVWTGTITLSGDGDYVVTMEYVDRSTNEMTPYKSQEIRIDTTAPVIDVTYAPEDATANEKYFNSNRKATITVTEHNFRAEDVDVTITAKDVTGNDVTIEDFDAYLKDRASWESNGDVHTAEIEFKTDAQYTFAFDSEDILNNEANQYVADDFVIDHESPTDLKISYSTPIIEKIIESITFGFYKADVQVTFTADDITSGIDFFNWSYTKQVGVSDKNAENSDGVIKTEDISYSDDEKTATATITIPASARGYISATATDRATNNDSYADDKHILVVDNSCPEVKVEYVADNAETKVQFTDNNDVTVEDFASAEKAYFDNNVTAKITVDEANFFEGSVTEYGEIVHNVGILLTKTDDNNVVTKYEYLPNGASQKYSDAIAKNINWTSNGDIHTFDIAYDEDSDYILTIDYTDVSENKAEIEANDGISTVDGTYTSKQITVDKTAPVVNVEYHNINVIHSLKERDSKVIRDYYNAIQTATITVTEHNFRAEDFISEITAKDITGKDIEVENFSEKLVTRSEWQNNGNIHTIKLEYVVDANYTFDYNFNDLSQNSAAEYDEDAFTVDTTAPENLTVTYEGSILDTILETVTFGFYNGQTKITITADDDVAGVFYFIYSYIKSEGVSGVNAELLNEKIEEANKNIEHKGKTSTTSFTIPKEALGLTNQFNGTVKFTAFDRSENNTELVDTKRIVVDNIKPTAKVTYNEPVQKANDISYYAGDINAAIVINEANFYKEDVIVTVTKDGRNYPVKVNWTDRNVDVHNGTFTLTEDGDYIVDIKYKDRSANEMAQYTSNRLTIDTKAPTVNASNIKMNSANKDKQYGFTITADDINMDSSTFKPVLTAVVRNDDGSYTRKTVSLGAMKTVEAGKTYSFTVGNLLEDAYYSLVCTLKDMSGNEYSKIALKDGREYDRVEFSINRSGSAFDVNKATDTLVDNYYVQGVNEDVVITEVNVDPIQNFTVLLNGEPLEEGKDYTTTLTNRANEWSKRTYTISKKLFKAEGEYSIVIESSDKAGTTAYSDVKNLNVSFVVDKTDPVLTITGLEQGGRYQVQEQTVTVIPTDDGGRLNSIKVIILDSDGKPIKDADGKDISVRFDMSGDEFLEYLNENDGVITFTIPEGFENQVHIICNDCAVDENGETNAYDEVFKKVTVSQSGWVIFYANKPAFYGSIAAVLLVVGIIFFIIFGKKRKKDKEEKQ